jgi:Flp pilus assembly protein TadD
LDIQGRPDLALPLYRRAYAAMDAAYPTEAQRVRAWQPRLGVLIAERHEAAGQTAQAEGWYRRVLDLAPYDPEAVGGLAALYEASGRQPEARLLCETLARKVGANSECEAVLRRG